MDRKLFGALGNIPRSEWKDSKIHKEEEDSDDEEKEREAEELMSKLERLQDLGVVKMSH
jgi:hypothetical protein